MKAVEAVPVWRRHLKAAVGVFVTALSLTSVALHESHHWLTALLWCGVFLLFGAMIGFIFGVSTSQIQPHNPDTASETVSRANTNLESISDWLTKILIGYTLIDLKEIPLKLQKLSEYVGSGLSGRADEPFVMALIIYFSSTGFIVAYLATQLYFRLIASEAGAKAIGSLSKAVEATLTREIMNALRAPVMSNYQGFICLRVRDDKGIVEAGRTPILLREKNGTIHLEAWLQPGEPSEPELAFAPVSITGGEERDQADFELRVDSDSFQSDRTSESFKAEKHGRTQTVAFRATFDLSSTRLEPQGSSSFGFSDQPYEMEDSIPRHPLWLMLFQHNRLVQTISLDFTLRN